MNARHMALLIAVFGTRALSVVGALVLSAAVARTAGPQGLANLALFLGILGVLSILANRGLNILLTREVASARHAGNSIRLRRILRRGLSLCMRSAAILALIGAGLIATDILGLGGLKAVLALLVSLPSVAVLSLVAAYANGVDAAWLSSLLSVGGVSLLATFLIVLADLCGLRAEGDDVLLLFAGAAVLAALPCSLWLYLQRRRDSEPTSNGGAANLDAGQVSFTLVALSTFLLQAGSFAVAGPWLDGASLGQLRAAERISLVVSFPMLAVQPFIAARVVRCVRSRDASSLWRLVVSASLGSFFLAVPAFLFILIAPDVSLRLMGPGFGDAAKYLQVLVIVQVLLVLLAPFATVIQMGGGERGMMSVSVCSLVCALTLYPLACIAWGAWGFVMTYALLSVGRAAFVAAMIPRVLRGAMGEQVSERQLASE